MLKQRLWMDLELQKMNSMYVLDGITSSNKVKEEADSMRMTQEFRVDSEEADKGKLCKNAPWVKLEQNDGLEVCIKQEFIATDEEVLRRETGCEKGPLVITARSDIDKTFQERCFNKTETLQKQICSQAQLDMCTDTASTSGSSCLRCGGFKVCGYGSDFPSGTDNTAQPAQFPESPLRQWRSSVSGLQMRHIPDVPEVDSTTETDPEHSEENDKSWSTSESHLNTVNVGNQQRKLMSSSQVPVNSGSANLLGHTGSHAGKKPFKCSKCRRKFSYINHLNKHMVTHAAGKVFDCSMCGKEFNKKTYLLKHVASHADETFFECNVCGKKFKRRGSFVQHIKSHTGEKPFQCNKCGRKFLYSTCFYRHMKIHTGRKTFDCSECGEKFSQQDHLLFHMDKHQSEKVFQCNDCRRKFTDERSLIQHKEVHVGEKPFDCALCGKKFYQKTSLREHIGSHSGEKPYECSECRKKFSYRSCLTRHIKIHTSKKPFSCSVCGKKFNQKTHLGYHMKVHSYENI